MSERPKKHHCKRHDVRYGALEQCPRCAGGDPAPAPQDVPDDPAPAPEGCKTSAEREAWYTTLAEAALSDAAALIEQRGAGDPESAWHVEVAIKSHRETAIKAMRAAGELGAEREADWLVAQRKREQASGG